ncbi:MAG: alpha/beta hydrolase family protein [Planctomycetota bacterium]
MRPRTLSLAAFSLALAAQHALAGDPTERFWRLGPHPVGVRTLVIVDPSREDPRCGGPRTLVTEVWYPAEEDARGGRPTRFAEFFGDRPDAAEGFVGHFRSRLEDVERRFRTIAVRGAKIRGGRCPLLVFSHGNGGVRHQNVFQMDHLASHGYVVASPDHTGNAGVTVLPDRVVPYDRSARREFFAERPADVRVVIDRLLEFSRDETHWLCGALDEGAIGVLGHSFGGYTACRVAAEDPRVKAILPMTVAIFARADVPLMVMLGELDRTVGKAGNLLSRGTYGAAAPPKYLLVLRRGGHYSFSDMDCIRPDFGDGIGAETRDGRRVEYLDPARTKAIVNAYSLAFFEAHLRSDPEAGAFLRRNHDPAEIEYHEK